MTVKVIKVVDERRYNSIGQDSKFLLKCPQTAQHASSLLVHWRVPLQWLAGLLPGNVQFSWNNTLETCNWSQGVENKLVKKILLYLSALWFLAIHTFVCLFVVSCTFLWIFVSYLYLLIIMNFFHKSHFRHLKWTRKIRMYILEFWLCLL